MTLVWDEANVGHIARHRIAPHEAEEALTIAPLITEIQEHTDENRWLCLGRTRAGRLLTVIFTERRSSVRVVTAFPMTKSQERIYWENV